MAKPEIHYISTGSNTAASGCPNAMTAVTGAVATCTGGGTTLTLGETKNLTGAAAGDAVWFTGSAATDRHLFEIVSFTGGVATCTAIVVVETFTNTVGGGGAAWAVGGKRLNGEYNATRYDVLDGSAGWTFWFEGSTTFDQSVRWLPAAGNSTSGGITIRGDSATTRATLRMTGNTSHVEMNSFLKVKYLIFTTNNATNTATCAIGAFVTGGGGVLVLYCKISTLFRGIVSDTCGVNVIGCEITGCKSSGIDVPSASVVLLEGCYIYGNNTNDTSGKGGISITMADAGYPSFTVVGSVVSANKRAGIVWDGAARLHVTNSVFYGNLATTGDGIVVTAIGAARATFLCLNNIFHSNASGKDLVGPTSAVVSAILDATIDYNAHVSGSYTNFAAGPNDVTLTGDPFTNAAGGDFSLNTTAGAGAAVKSLGLPITLPGGSTTTNVNIGLAQNIFAAAGGLLRHPGMSGGISG